MTELSQTLREIRANHVREDYIYHVKAAFRARLEELEPEASIEDTHYFNHSAIPDFKLTWPRVRGSVTVRDYYLRSSYASVVAANDTANISTGDPVFMAIDPEQSVTESGFEMAPADVQKAAGRSKTTLLTDVVAVDEITRGAERDETPLSVVVRSNFLRGARGLVDERVAENLVQSAAHPDEAGVSGLIRETFLEDAVLRMERTAAFVDWALASRDQKAELVAAPEVFSGAMGTEELRALLPWVLSLPDAPEDESFWSHLGALVEFSQLERIADLLEGYDLTRFVQANLSRWTAKRSYLGLNVQSGGDDEEVVVPHWEFRGGRLGFAVGEHEVRVSDTGYKLQARPGGRMPRWSSLEPRLTDFSVHAVSLAGVERTLRIASQQQGSINRDVEAVVETVADDYFVETVDVLLPGPADEEGDADRVAATIDFSGGIVISPTSVQLGALTRAAANLIGSLGLDSDLVPVPLVEAGGGTPTEGDVP
ncbi:hypothetical protein [Georgenia sp. Marseille-Q6866]